MNKETQEILAYIERIKEGQREIINMLDRERILMNYILNYLPIK